MMSTFVAKDVSFWDRSPARLNKEICGPYAKFYDNFVVERESGTTFGAVCFTADPLPPDRVWEISWYSVKVAHGEAHGEEHLYR